MTVVAEILKSKPDPTVHTVRPEDSVLDALRLMAEKGIGALLVTQDADRIVGIFTERDYARKIALLGRTSAATQVRDVLFTTATHKNTDGSTFDYWTAPDGVPDERYGWGMPDLEKGMYGPGQFLGRVQYNASKAPLDVWSNNISQIAIKQREREDLQWLANYKQQGIAFAGDLASGIARAKLRTLRGSDF